MSVVLLLILLALVVTLSFVLAIHLSRPKEDEQLRKLHEQALARRAAERAVDEVMHLIADR